MGESEDSIRHCANVKSRKYPDVCCKSLATHGEFCQKHYKNPIRFPIIKPNTIQVLSKKRIHILCKLQRWLKNVLCQRRVRQQGPSGSRSQDVINVSSNTTEVYSLEPIETIIPVFMWSYIDQGRLWTFDIRSFRHMMTAGKSLQNPYTREPLSDKVKASLEARLEWLRIRRFPICFLSTTELSIEQAANLRLVDIFLKMDFLGYHAPTEWFSDLTLSQQQTFYGEIYELWTHRLGIREEDRAIICPVLNTIMKGPLINVLHVNRPARWWRKLCLDIMDALVSSAKEKSDRSTCSMYLLTALCRVSLGARQHFSWLCGGGEIGGGAGSAFSSVGLFDSR